MADFNQSPSGQSSTSITVTAIVPVTSGINPVWKVPEWTNVTGSTGSVSFAGSVVTTFVRPLDNRVVPYRLP